MICYRCGTALGAGKRCLHCGADVSTYKKIVRIANGYYNAGLEKARVRDLSGAKEELLTALKYDKRNISARNLLGLIYYETGEVVEALCQWVISKNYQTLENPADAYIRSVQEDKNGLEVMNQAIKGYNSALASAAHDGEDLAIIQLQRVLISYPHMMKAYQLLALLYIKTGEYSKAGKIIKKGLQIDKGCVLLQRYAGEIRGRLGRPKSSQKQAVYTEQAAAAAGADVIVPQYREAPKAIQLLAGAVIGMLICLAAYIFLIKPSIERNARNEKNQMEISYNEKVENKDSDLVRLENQIGEVQAQLEANNKKIEQYDGEDGTITNYNRLFNALTLYREENWTELMSVYATINAEVIENTDFKAQYDELGDFIYGEGLVGKIVEEAKEQYLAGQYTKCKKTCQACIDINPDCDGAIFYMAMAWEAQGNDSKAAPYFQEIVDRFPDSEYYAQARRRVA